MVAHERLVVTRAVHAVEELPAVATVVAEAGEVAAKVGARLARAAVAHGVLQVGVYLHLLAG